MSSIVAASEPGQKRPHQPGDPGATHVIRVALDVPLPRLFDYLANAVGPAAITAADIGRRVSVPFGKTTHVGMLVAVEVTPECAPEALKPIFSIDRDTPPLSADVLALGRFAARYYHAPLGSVLVNLWPPALRQARFRTPPPAAYQLTAAGCAAGPQLPTRAHAQRALFALLAAGPVARAAVPAYASVLRVWLNNGWVEAAPGLMPPATIVGETAPTLTPEQITALAALRQAEESAAGFNVHLLFGVTGSGKTELYLQRCADVLAAGQQALLLVPEIHLTPQLIERVHRRFPTRRVVALHSLLADGERLTAWLDCMHDRADIVLGTRLAVFAPLSRPGLIVIDEEHDAAYKQGEGLRYSARDLAIWRARQSGAQVILGSATPALESWYNAQCGRYQPLYLNQRAHAEASLPTVKLIDTRTDRPRQGLSRQLHAAIADGLARGEQSLVFINRRGYAPVQQCSACAHIVDCPRCAAHLVLHRRGSGNSYWLRCHHCGYQQAPVSQCPTCQSRDLRATGQGTQRIEEHLAEQFPEARILRVDRDSTQRKGGFAAMREAIASQRVNLIVGTQILAKGHDFPHLTQVMVIGADSALQAPDFRAGERLFAQLMQVGGRAGRADKPGTVWIQTDWPQHPLYVALRQHDYAGFAQFTLRERRDAGFPPYMHLAVLRADAPSMTAAMAFLEAARHLVEQTITRPDNVVLFDPVPALLARVARRERAQLLVQSPHRDALQHFLQAWVPVLYALPARAVRWSLDVDPAEF